jgi:Mn-dependent DtxR family transcriptional regulator
LVTDRKLVNQPRQIWNFLYCAAVAESLLPRMPSATTPSRPSQSAEDYLERIQELIDEKGYARVVDIANSLDVTQASVTNMVQKLAEMGYIDYEKYRGLTLTDKGGSVAARIQKRHATLARFFSLLELDELTQLNDIEGIEHHLSPETVECLDELASFFENNPGTLKAFKKSRGKNGPKSS